MSAVEEYRKWKERPGWVFDIEPKADAAIAELEAERDKYKWQRDEAISMYREMCSISTADEIIADLDRRWEADHD